MLFNLCVNWNETRGTVFNKKNTNLLQYAIQLVCVLKWNKRGSFQKKIQLMTISCWTCERKETRGAVFKKQQCITVCYSTCVRIEMKQEGQFSTKKTCANWLQYAIQLVCVLKWNKRGSFQKNPIDDNMQLNSCVKWNKRDSLQKKSTIDDCMLLNSCGVLKWNKRGSFQKNNTNLLLYAIQLVCVLKWNKMDSFQQKKHTIYYSMLFNSCAYWNETREVSFQKTTNLLLYAAELVSEKKLVWQYWKNNNLLQYARELVCVLKWKPRGSVFKKHQFITVCYSTCMHIEMKQEGTVFNKKNTNLLQYAIQLVCELKWNKRGQFSTKKSQIDDNMLLNSWAYWNETRGAVFKKQQFITVCYSTSVRIEMKKEGQFSKNNNLLLYAIQLVCILKWYKRDSF